MRNRREIESMREALAALLRTAGHTVRESVGTGGGCTAMLVGDDTGRHILVTNGNAEAPFTDHGGPVAEQEIVAVLYRDANDEGTLILSTTVEDFTDGQRGFDLPLVARIVGGALR